VARNELDDPIRPPEAEVRTAFDQALENQALGEAAEDYALHHGNPGSPEYRAAWLRFRQRVRTVDDLMESEAAGQAFETAEVAGRTADPTQTAALG